MPAASRSASRRRAGGHGVCLILLAIATTSVAHAEPATSPWEQVRTDQGIIVHRRKVAGSSLHEFRGRGSIGAPMAKIIAVVQDVTRRTEWMDRCVEARQLERPTERSQIAYNRTKGALAVADRDAVIHGHAIFDVARKEVRFEFRAIPYPREPAHKGVVRMPHLKGHWILRAVPGNERTEVEYQVHADPGGLLPTFIVNLISRELPHKTIMHLRRQVHRASYATLEAQINALPEYQQIVK